MPGQVVENSALHRFELAIDGSEEIAAAYYRVDDNGNIVLTHTEVPFEFSGRGIGSHLAQGVFDLLRSSGRKAVLLCPFMAAYYSRHPEYSDIVAG
jgi:predicted GNAT family acetyltransferase